MRKESDILCIYLWTGRELAQVEEKSLGIGYKRLPKLKVELVVWPLPPTPPPPSHYGQRGRLISFYTTPKGIMPHKLLVIPTLFQYIDYIKLQSYCSFSLPRCLFRHFTTNMLTIYFQIKDGEVSRDATVEDVVKIVEDLTRIH